MSGFGLGFGFVGEDMLVVDGFGLEELLSLLLVIVSLFGSTLLFVGKTIRPSKVDIHCVPTEANKALVRTLVTHTSIKQYKPPRVLVNKHTSTLFAAIGKRPPTLPFRRVHLDTPDGGVLGIDILEPVAHLRADPTTLTVRLPCCLLQKPILFFLASHVHPLTHTHHASRCAIVLALALALALALWFQVFLLPGIAGDSDAPYIRSLARGCHLKGWRVRPFSPSS